MLIMFQTQMESVGLHQNNWQGSIVRVHWWCTCICFHRRVLRQTGRVTDTTTAANKDHAKCTLINNELLGSCGDSDRHCGIIHFHPPAQAAAGRLLACFCWWLKLSAYNDRTFQSPLWTDKPRTESDLIRVMQGWSKLRLPIHNNRQSM